MKGKGVGSDRVRFCQAIGFAMCCLSIAGLSSAGGVPKSDSATASSAESPTGVLKGENWERQLLKILPGKSTKAQVVALLGRPWRTVQYNDADEIEDEIWEYRGIGSQGSFRVHIEFDREGVVQIVGKIPDADGESNGTPARSTNDHRGA